MSVADHAEPLADEYSYVGELVETLDLAHWTWRSTHPQAGGGCVIGTINGPLGQSRPRAAECHI